MGVPWETVTLTSFGRNKQLYFNILEEGISFKNIYLNLIIYNYMGSYLFSARKMALTRTEGKTVMYTAMGPDWRPFGHPRKRRPINSVVLDNGIGEKILADIKEFLSCPSWYSDRGMEFIFVSYSN
jgi:chaperone BCS1